MCTASEFMGILVVYFFTVILIQVYFEYLIILLSISGSKDWVQEQDKYTCFSLSISQVHLSVIWSIFLRSTGKINWKYTFLFLV